MAGYSTNTERLTLESVGGSLGDLLRKYHSTFVKDYVKVNPGQTIMPYLYKKWMDKYEEFQVKKDDVWLVTYPKAGTTWTQEITRCLMFDMESEAINKELMKIFPYFEFDTLVSSEDMLPEMPDDFLLKAGTTWKILQSLKSPRPIKTHFPASLLPPSIWTEKPKIIYVARDPRDVCVSYYYHCKKLEGFQGDFDIFFQLFLGDLLTYSPIWPHMIEFWNKRDEPNVLFITYEDLKEDMPAIVRKISDFLDIYLTELKLMKIVDHCSFSSMRGNTTLNHENYDMNVPKKGEKKIQFIRKGIVGDWKNHFSADQTKAFKNWTMKNVKGTDFPFYQNYD